MDAKLPIIAVVLVLIGGGVYVMKTLTNQGRAVAQVERTPPTWTEAPVPVVPPKEEKKEEKTPEPPAKTEFNTYQEGMDAAKKANKHAFVVFHADWCGWCKKLEKDTLSDAGVKEKLKNLVVVHVDADKEPGVVTKFRVTGLPAYFIVSPDGQVVKTGSGYKNVNDFKAWTAMAAIRED